MSDCISVPLIGKFLVWECQRQALYLSAQWNVIEALRFATLTPTPNPLADEVQIGSMRIKIMISDKRQPNTIEAYGRNGRLLGKIVNLKGIDE